MSDSQEHTHSTAKDDTLNYSTTATTTTTTTSLYSNIGEYCELTEPPLVLSHKAITSIQIVGVVEEAKVKFSIWTVFPGCAELILDNLFLQI
jgi:hypothetical protein